jgi:uncharacterized membrane protein (DUF485 family)
MSTRARVVSWLAVALVGAIVVALVIGLSLFPRLNAAQSVIDRGSPAFDAKRMAGDRAAINMVDTAVTVVDKIASPQGGVSAEVPRLVKFVSAGSGLSQADVMKALRTNFPHTTGLLLAVPLSSVSTELPGLVPFLAKVMKLTPDQVTATLRKDYPHLLQAITALPVVTAGWYNVPNIAGLTRFNGTPVRSVPDTAAYFSGDVVPVLENQQPNFQSLAAKGGVGFLDGLLLTVGLIVLVFGLLMAYLASRGLPAPIAAAGWAVVVAVGALVVGLVLGLSLFPRLTDGQELVDGARPAFAAQRVAGDRAAINMLSQVVQVADPIATPAGGAAQEVPKLLALVSSRSGLPQSKVLAALQAQFPHTTGLLQAIPLSAVTTEIPKLVSFLSTALKLPPAKVTAALEQNFPNLAQAIALLPAVTNGWNNVPGTTGLTRFDGTPVRTVPQVRDYFAADVIPVLEAEQANFRTVDETWPPLPVFPPLLLVVGLLVILYGLAMLLLTLRAAPAASESGPSQTRQPTHTRG